VDVSAWQVRMTRLAVAGAHEQAEPRPRPSQEYSALVSLTVHAWCKQMREAARFFSAQARGLWPEALALISLFARGGIPAGLRLSGD